MSQLSQSHAKTLALLNIFHNSLSLFLSTSLFFSLLQCTYKKYRELRGPPHEKTTNFLSFNFISTSRSQCMFWHLVWNYSETKITIDTYLLLWFWLTVFFSRVSRHAFIPNIMNAMENFPWFPFTLCPLLHANALWSSILVVLALCTCVS